MQMPGSTYNSGDYTFGFQGQEHDDEVAGAGNSTFFKYRMHDPRTGRFYSIDPLAPEYPELTPYQFSSNSVIGMVEIEGLEGSSIPADNYNGYKRALENGYDADMKGRTSLRISFAKLLSPYKIGDDFLDYYEKGDGAPYILSIPEMVELFPVMNYESEPIQVGPVESDFKRAEEALKDGATSVHWEDMHRDVYSGVPEGGLGRTYIDFIGEFTLDDNGDVVFNGTVYFDDEYDFKWSKTRKGAGNLMCFIARNCLPGKPYDQKGQIDVKQKQGDDLRFSHDNSKTPKVGSRETKPSLN